MGWAEIGLGPQAEARATERRAGRSGSGDAMVDPDRAKARLHQTLGEFWSHGVWLAAVVVVAVVAMALEGVSGAPLAIAVVLGIVAAAVVVAWAWRLGHWARPLIRR